jgi:hypothetical protein
MRASSSRQPSLLQPVGVAQQRERAQGDQARRRLVAGHEQQEDHREQLVLAQPLPLARLGGERADEVVGGRVPLALDQPAHVSGQRPQRLGPALPNPRVPGLRVPGLRVLR